MRNNTVASYRTETILHLIFRLAEKIKQVSISVKHLLGKSF